MNAIELRDLTLKLGGRVVLADISLAIPSGQFIGVLGPNGSGKTSLMRALLGLVPPSGGTISVLGRPATRGNPRIGYMPQGSGAAPPVARLSGWDFVASVANGHRLGLPILSKAARAETERALDLVGAAKLARRPLADLSGGERQRLLLAQALVGEPQLLLLDEPLISLDPHHQQDVVELVKRLQDELKITILFSAHEINPLLSAIDQVLYLGGGKAALGAVDEVITGPVLSRLYGAEIDVIRVKGRIFVMSGGYEVERDEHRHEAAHGHGAAHGRGAHGHV
ncbi:MAG TPA: ABC transporter ATP-binding protein [Methylovirgula sp.]|nr:ABC transporter ATP-binding protein [Methylovirgula sp.]